MSTIGLLVSTEKMVKVHRIQETFSMAYPDSLELPNTFEFSHRLNSEDKTT